MSYLHFNYVRANSRTTELARLVLLMIADRANDEGVAWPGLSSLASDCNSSKRAVQRAIDRIPGDELQVISKGGSDAGAEKRSTRYRIVIPDAHQTDDRKSPVVVMTDDFKSPVPVTVSHPTDDRKSPEPVTVSHPNHNKPPSEPSVEPPKDKKARKLAGSIDSLSLPLFLNKPEFRKALADWQDHRKANRCVLTQHALELLVGKCEKWGLEKSIEYINHSIERGWAGVYPPKDTGKRPSDLAKADYSDWRKP